MKLLNYLNEISVKKGTDIKVTENSANAYYALITLVDGLTFDLKARLGDDRYTFRMLQITDEKLIDKAMEAKLVTKDAGGAGAIKTWDIMFFDSSGAYEVSAKRKGAALELFAALEKAFDDFVKTKKPLVFSFSAKSNEASRTKLYDLLAKKYTNKNKYSAVAKQVKMLGEKLYVFYTDKWR